MQMYIENLKKLRKELGLSVAKLAEKLEMPNNTIAGYEYQKRTPSITLCVQLYTKLNVNLNWFISGEGEMFNHKVTDYEKTKADILQEVKTMLQNEGVIKQ